MNPTGRRGSRVLQRPLTFRCRCAHHCWKMPILGFAPAGFLEVDAQVRLGLLRPLKSGTSVIFVPLRHPQVFARVDAFQLFLVMERQALQRL